MAISLYLGPYQPFLEGQLLRCFQDYRARNPLDPVTLLVPNFLLVGHLRRTLAKKGINLFNLRIQTLHRHLSDLAEEKAVEEGLKLLPEALIPWVLKEVGRPLLSESSVFGSARETQGFYRALRSTLGELREGAAAPEDLKRLSGAFPKQGPAPGLGRKLLEFSQILSAYSQWKRRNGWMDREDLYFRALEEKEGRESGCLWVYGFYDASRLQRWVLARLSSGVESRWFIPYEDHPAFEYAKPFVDWARSLGKVERQEAWGPTGQGALERLQATLFNGENGKGGSLRRAPEKAEEDFDASPLKIFLCPGEPREAGELAKALLREASLREAALPDCAVILRDTAAYRKILPPALEGQHLPLSRTVSGSLLETNEGKSLLLLVDCFTRDYPRDVLMDFLACPHLEPAGFSIALSDWNPSLWDLLSREARITEGREEWGSRLEAWRAWKERENKEEEEGSGATGEIRSALAFRKVLERLFEAGRKFHQEKKWEAKARQLRRCLQTFCRPSSALQEAGETLESFAVLAESFSLALEPGDFRSLLASLLEEKKHENRERAEGGVQVVDLMQARGVSFEVAALPGLVEGGMPKPVRQDPLLLDEERGRLNERAGDGFLPLKKSGALEERLLFTFAVRSARKALLLTAPHLNPSNGSPRTPSLYLFEAVEAVLGKRINRLGEAAGLVKAFSTGDWVKGEPALCGERLETLLTVLHLARQGTPAPALALLKDGPFYFQGCELMRGRQASRVFTPYDGILQDPRAREELRKRHSLDGKPLSASRLEAFAACPLRYFYRHVLELEVHPEPEPTPQLQAVDRGNLLHDILERALSRGVQEGWVSGRDPERGFLALQEEADAVFRRFEKEGLTGALALWLSEKERMRADLERVVRGVLSEEEWEPFAFEAAFGEGEDPVAFPLKSGVKVPFRGRMDRVDLSRDGKSLRVVDYKSGSATGVSDNRVKGGKKLQLPLYLWALGRMHPDKAAREALYDFITRKGGYRKVEYQEQAPGDLEKVLDQVLSTAQEAVEGGLFPAVGRECDSCDYRKLCGTGMEGRGKRKEKDGKVQAYYQLEELK